jgi:hypothetical protein
VLVPGERLVVPDDVAARWVRRNIAAPTGESQPGSAPLAPAEPTAATPLPDDFPARDLLMAYGLDTLELLRGMSEDDLVKLKGIGPAKARAIAHAL